MMTHLIRKLFNNVRRFSICTKWVEAVAVEQLRFNLEVVGSYITGYLFLSLLCYPS